MANEKPGPEWGYREENGVMVAKLFPEGRPPSGWADTPAKPEPKKPKAK